MSATMVLSERLVDTKTNKPVKVFVINGYEIPVTNAVIAACIAATEGLPANPDSPFTERGTSRKVHSALVAGKHVPITQAVCSAILLRTETLDIPEIRVGRLLDPAMQRAFAELRSQGCFIEYAERDKRFTSVSYYSVSITGPAIYLDAFLKWVSSLHS